MPVFLSITIWEATSDQKSHEKKATRAEGPDWLPVDKAHHEPAYVQNWGAVPGSCLTVRPGILGMKEAT